MVVDTIDPTINNLIKSGNNQAHVVYINNTLINN